MKWKVLVIGIMSLGVAALVYLLVRIQIQHLRPKVVQVEKEVVREILGQVSTQEIEKALDSLNVYARVVGEDLQIPQLLRRGKGNLERAYRPIFVKGINFGAALPGSYPAEFTPTHEDYLRWFGLMRKAGFNVIRVYTVFPPEFYSALAEYNLRNRKHPLYLLQGIWVPIPEDEDYLAPDFVRRIKAEIEWAVDAIHGARNYFVDISEITLGFLFGREWEPNGIQTTEGDIPTVQPIPGTLSPSHTVPLWRPAWLKCWIISRHMKWSGIAASTRFPSSTGSPWIPFITTASSLSPRRFGNTITTFIPLTPPGFSGLPGILRASLRPTTFIPITPILSTWNTQTRYPDLGGTILRATSGHYAMRPMGFPWWWRSLGFRPLVASHTLIPWGSTRAVTPNANKPKWTFSFSRISLMRAMRAASSFHGWTSGSNATGWLWILRIRYTETPCGIISTIRNRPMDW